MERQQSHTETLRSVAGSALAGLGLFLLFGHVVRAADRLSRVLEQTAGPRLEVVSTIMLAASLNWHHFAYVLFAMLWPALLVVGGTVLLGEGSSDGSGKSGRQQGLMNRPCVDCA